MTRTPPQWLSTEQIASELGMSSEWVRRQIERGRLRATLYMTGRRPTYRVDRSDLQTFIARYVQTIGDEEHPRRSV